MLRRDLCRAMTSGSEREACCCNLQLTMRKVLHATVNLEETSTQQGRKSSKSTHGIMFENSISPDFGCGRLGGEMKAGGASRPCNSATNAALLCATVSRNSRILAKSCNQMLLRRRLRSLSMLPNDPSPSVYLPQTAIARPTRTQAQKCYSTRRQLESCARNLALCGEGGFD